MVAVPFPLQLSNLFCFYLTCGLFSINIVKIEVDVMLFLMNIFIVLQVLGILFCDSGRRKEYYFSMPF